MLSRPLFAALGLLALNACASDPVNRGGQLFADNCTQCHGRGGTGDGPLAAELDIAPTDLTLLRFANGGVFPRDAVMATIYGYSGKFETGLMPEFGPVLTGPTRVITTQDGARIATPEALIALVAYIEGLQQE